MKILFLNSPPSKKMGIVGQIYPPLGILYLASYVRTKIPNIELKVVDGYHENGIDIVLKKIREFAPDILAVSFTTQAATGAYKIINAVKECGGKSSIIIAGGPHPTAYTAECFTRSKPDIVVIGEGEETFCEIVSRVKANEDWLDVAGTVCQTETGLIINEKRRLIANLDLIPFPARDLVDLKIYPGYHYKKSSWDTSYISGRGCPYDCVYCSNPVWKSQKPWIRFRSPANVVDEIEHLKSHYGVSEFYDQTDLFNGDLKWSKDVCHELIARKLNINWKVQMTVKNIDDELAELMVQSGCWLGILGVETGNDTTSKGINKQSDRFTAEKSLTTLKRHGMKTFALLMGFNVWEDGDELKYENKTDTLNTLKFAKEMIKKGVIDIVSWSLTTPYPGSKLFEIAKKHSLIPADLEGKWELWDSSENFIMRLPGITVSDWRIIRNKGKMLQIMLLTRSGTFNIRSIPIYIKKMMRMIVSALSRLKIPR